MDEKQPGSKLAALVAKAHAGERIIMEHTSAKETAAQQRQKLSDMSRAHWPAIAAHVEAVVSNYNKELGDTRYKLNYTSKSREDESGIFATASVETGRWGVHFHGTTDGKLRTVDTLRSRNLIGEKDRDSFEDHDEHIETTIAKFIDAAIDAVVKDSTKTSR